MGRIQNEPKYDAYWNGRPTVSFAHTSDDIRMEGRMENRRQQVGEYIRDLIGMKWVLLVAMEEGWFNRRAERPIDCVYNADFEDLIYFISISNIFNVS